MRNIFRLALLVLALSAGAFAQGFHFDSQVAAPAADISIPTLNTGIAYHKLTWNLSAGSITTCTIQLDSSVDGTSWTAGGVIGATDCHAANGQTAATNAVVNYVRINVTAVSGGSVSITWNGTNSSPSGGGTVTSVTGTINQLDSTGGATPVLSIDPVLILPGTINRLTLTAPATGSTLTIVDGKVFRLNNTLTFAGTDGSTLNVGAGGTLAAGAFAALPLSSANGGTALDTSASTGVPQIASGVWSVSTTLPSGLSATNLTLVTPALGTPSSGVVTNLTGTGAFNSSGSAASLSVSGQTGLVTLTGITSTNRAKTVRDAADTLLELGGSYTPTGTWTNLTLVTPALGTPSAVVLTNATGFPSAIVQNNQANTGTTAVTMDLSASTVANAFKVPIGAGLTAGADGVIAYDTTVKITHLRTNGADSLAVAETAAIVSGTIPKSASSTLPTLTGSSLSDNGVRVLTTEPISVGTAAGAPGLIDITAGYNTAAMSVQSTATCTNITGMTWNIAANKRYIMSCEIPITLAVSATVGFCLGGPGTATSYSLEADGPIGAAAAYAQISTLAQTAYGTKTGSSSAVGAAEWVHVKANIQNGATASGTALTLQTFGNGSQNLTVGADASCTLTQQN